MDEANATEMSQLRCYGDLMVEKMTTAFGEWNNFSTTPMKFDYDNKPSVVALKKSHN